MFDLKYKIKFWVEQAWSEPQFQKKKSDENQSVWREKSTLYLENIQWSNKLDDFAKS